MPDKLIYHCPQSLRFYLVLPCCTFLRKYLGQWEKAVNLIDVALRLTSINKPWYPTVKACSLFISNKVDQALSISEMVLDYQPNNLEALLVLGAVQVDLGMNRRARQTLNQINRLLTSVDVEAWFDNSPYRSQELIERWKSDLAMAG